MKDSLASVVALGVSFALAPVACAEATPGEAPGVTGANVGAGGAGPAGAGMGGTTAPPLVSSMTGTPTGTVPPVGNGTSGGTATGGVTGSAGTVSMPTGVSATGTAGMTSVGTGGSAPVTGTPMAGAGPAMPTGTVMPTGTAMAGTTSSGTGSTAGSTATGTGANACTGAATNNGLYDNGTICGYAWTATNMQGETIDPPCGDSGGECFAGDTLCATATVPPNVAADEVYTGVMIGWNVTKTDGGTWTISGSGITVDFNDGGATGQVRILVQVGSTDYCVNNAASGTHYDWSEFVTDCWGTDGNALAATAKIKAIVVQVNGSDTAEQSLTDFCLNGVSVDD